MLKFIKEQMDILDIPYEFGEWTQALQYPYFVGELPSPEDNPTEDGKEVQTLILNGWHRGQFTDLEFAKEKIKQHFHTILGRHGWTDSGSISVYYEGAFYIPTGEADLKRIQINLKILQWKGV